MEPAVEADQPARVVVEAEPRRVDARHPFERDEERTSQGGEGAPLQDRLAQLERGEQLVARTAVRIGAVAPERVGAALVVELVEGDVARAPARQRQRVEDRPLAEGALPEPQLHQAHGGRAKRARGLRGLRHGGGGGGNGGLPRIKLCSESFCRSP